MVCNLKQQLKNKCHFKGLNNLGLGSQNYLDPQPKNTGGLGG